ncbi:MAG: hypothetical protein ACF8OB_12705 [Phycisphaeraceae bacterium JB051]
MSFTPVSQAQDLPSLDDLLDLDVPQTQNKPTTEDKPIDPDTVTAQQGRNALERAVGRMEDVATRMGDDRDVSLSLQRQQEEIIKDLDQVIAAAKKQQQQQSSSSSSSSSSSQQQQQQNQQNDTKQNSQQRSDATKSNKQSKAASQQQQNQPSNNAGDQAASMATQDPGNKAQPMESGKVEWGNLPPRLRDELMQGTQERFSPVYEKQTEAYYRRLAEEAK